MINLMGKISIVTGSAQGIGRSIALTLAQKGSDVIVVDINLQKAHEVREEIRKIGRKSLAIQVDVTDKNDVRKGFEKAIKEFKGVDILVNNAGILQVAFIADISEGERDRVIDVNLKGVFLCSQCVISHMVKKKRGRIINIASIGGKDGFPLAGVHYSASKAGVMGFTRQLAKQVAPYGITVNAVAPGTTDSGMIAHRTDAQKAEILKKIPEGRLGRPEDTAEAVAFLASDEADFITGETLDVCGGLYMA